MEIEAHYNPLTYGKGIDYLLSQQKNSRFMQLGLQTKTGLTGKRHQIKGIGKAELTEVTGKYKPVVAVEGERESRWIEGKRYQRVEIFDEEDDIFAEAPADSEVVTTFVSGYGRKFDDVCIGKVGGSGGLLGTTYAGINGTDAKTLAAGRFVACPNGLRLQDLYLGLEMLSGADTDEDDPNILVVSPSGGTDLLESGQAVADSTANTRVYNWGQTDMLAMQAAYQGKISQVAGMTVMKCTRPAIIASNNKYTSGGTNTAGMDLAILFKKSALRPGFWGKGVKVLSDRRPDLDDDARQLKILTRMGSLRQAEEKVVVFQITNVPTT